MMTAVMMNAVTKIFQFCLKNASASTASETVYSVCMILDHDNRR